MLKLSTSEKLERKSFLMNKDRKHNETKMEIITLNGWREIELINSILIKNKIKVKIEKTHKEAICRLVHGSGSLLVIHLFGAITLKP